MEVTKGRAAGGRCTVRSTEDEERVEKKQKRGGSILHDIVACILPIVCLAAALAGGVFVYRYANNSIVEAQATIRGEGQANGVVIEEAAPYAGVADPWNQAGSFTVGNEELDAWIKAFCDEHTPEDAKVEEAAKETYDAIVLSTYLDRVDKPMGTDWVARSARDYFSSDDGMGGYQGDYYEFSSVLALCLRYFGYADAIAVPIVRSMPSGEEYGSALCLVTNLDGVGSVCDPSLGVDGWMIARAGYDILVDDIGQNLDAAEAIGLRIQKKDETGEAGDDNGYGYNTGESNGGTSGTYNSSESDSGYDDDTYGGSDDEDRYGYNDYSDGDGSSDYGSSSSGSTYGNSTYGDATGGATSDDSTYGNTNSYDNANSYDDDSYGSSGSSAGSSAGYGQTNRY